MHYTEVNNAASTATKTTALADFQIQCQLVTNVCSTEMPGGRQAVKLWF